MQLEEYVQLPFPVSDFLFIAYLEPYNSRESKNYLNNFPPQLLCYSTFRKAKTEQRCVQDLNQWSDQFQKN